MNPGDLPPLGPNGNAETSTALRAITRCLQAIVRASDEAELTQQICEIIIGAGYRFCWVGAAEQGEERAVRPLAWAGYEDGYLSTIRVSWSDSQFGKGPTGTAIRTGKRQIIYDIAQRSDYLWYQEAARRGYVSVCALPLVDGCGAFGALNIYADNTEAFLPASVEMLSSLAEALAHGIASLREKVEQQRTVSQLRHAEQAALFAIDAVKIGTWAWDLRTNAVEWSDTTKGILGYPPEQKITYDFFINTVLPEDQERVASAITAALKDKGEYRIVARSIRADGEVRWMAVRGRVLCDEAGEPVRMLGVVIDDTERQKEERERGRLIEVVQNNPDLIGVADRDARVLFVNKAGQQLVGLESDEEASSKTIFDFMPANQIPLFQNEVVPAILAGKPWLGEAAVKHFKTGEVIPIEVRAFGVRDANGDVIALASVSRDIRERRLMEAERLKLVQIVENSPDSIGLADPRSGHGLFLNRAGRALIGIEDDETLSAAQIFDAIAPGDRLKVADEVVPKVLAGETWVGEIGLQHIRTKDVIPCELMAFPLWNDQGEIVALAKIAHDLRPRKKLESQYQQAQKMEAIGRLAGGVAHDFNNLLSVILGYCELTVDLGSPEPTVAKNVDRIKHAALRAADLTRQLLAFSRQQLVHRRAANLNAIVGNLLDMLRRMVGEDISVSFKPGASQGTVEVDVGQIEQVLMNLCVNARDAMPTGGHIAIETKNVVLDGSEMQPQATVEPGPYIMLAVGDSGTGIPKDNLGQIFEPFFTTKGPGKGTGLGLATVYGIVAQNRGHITVYSELKVGTTFKIYLPSVRVQERVVPAEAPQEPRGGSETVLLVEDEGSLRDVAASMLTGAGYRVLEADNADSAMNVARQFTGNIDLVITDVIMPNTSGATLAKQLQELLPKVRILYFSGYASDRLQRYLQSSSEVNFLDKPFSKRDLLLTVRSVLDSKAEGPRDGTS